MKRLFDMVMATMLLILLSVPMLLVAVAVYLTSKGPVLYWSNRVGRANMVFKNYSVYRMERVTSK